MDKRFVEYINSCRRCIAQWQAWAEEFKGGRSTKTMLISETRELAHNIETNANLMQADWEFECEHARNDKQSLEGVA